MTTPGSPKNLRLLFDEQLEARVSQKFEAEGYHCENVRALGLGGTKDHKLFPALRDKGNPYTFDVFVAADSNIIFQNNFKHDPDKKDLSLLVIRPKSLNLDAIEPHIRPALDALEKLKRNENKVVFVGEPEKVHQDQATYLAHQLRQARDKEIRAGTFSLEHDRKAKPTQPNNGGLYSGKILGEIDGVTYQSVSKKQFIMHQTGKLPDKLQQSIKDDPGQLGASYVIKYGKGGVVECKINEQQKGPQQGRRPSKGKGL